MARLLIVGAGGMLGHKLCQQLPNRGHEVVGTVRKANAALSRIAPHTRLVENVDALEGGRLERVVLDLLPQFVINCIGIVKQHREASNKYLSTAVNAWLPHRLERSCREVGAQLLHISTDCVFSGSRGNYTESDPSDAQDLYGKSKWLGEPECAVTLRTSIIGRELGERTHGLLEWFLAQDGKIVDGYARSRFSGLTTNEMSRVVGLVIEKHSHLSGIYHVASVPISKFELLQLIRAETGIGVEINRNDTFVCDRSLVMKRFALETGYRTPSWESMLKEMCSDPTPYDQIGI